MGVHLWTLFGILALGLCVSAHFGGNEIFKQKVRAHLLQEHGALQRKNATIGLKYVDAPKVFAQKAFGVPNGLNCEPGYTGTLCNIPMCHEKGYINPHNGSFGVGEAIALGSSYECDANVTIPVDSYISDLIVSVLTLGNDQPKAVFIGPDGNVVQPDDPNNDLNSFDYFQSSFLSIVNRTGTGYYQVQLSSMSTGPCSYQVTARTSAVIDAGFVSSVHDDNIKTETYTEWRLLQNPIQGKASFLGAKLSAPSQIAVPQTVTFYNSENQHYPPENLGIRYGCDAAYISPLYLCDRTDFYKVKFLGFDHTGFPFQRMYTFTCDGVEPTGGPVVPPTSPNVTSCENGGTLVTTGMNSDTCICPYYYRGYQCEQKICFNEGLLLNDGNCNCKDGYGGPFCLDVRCTNSHDDNENFNTNQRALVFVVRTSTSFAAALNTTALAAAQRIVQYNTFANPGYYRAYVLIGFANSELSFKGEFQDGNSFLSAFATLNTTDAAGCTDSVYDAISEAITSDSVARYVRSPTFVFTDVLPGDTQNQPSLFAALATYQGPVFTFFLDDDAAACPLNQHDPTYRELRRLAQFSHGLVATLPTNNSVEPVFNLATTIESRVSLAMNDFVDQCSFGAKYTTFFVDESIGTLAVIATGQSLNLTVRNTQGQTVVPSSKTEAGNIIVYTYQAQTKGNYLLETFADSTGPCQFRVLGDSAVDLFIGAADVTTKDIDHRQPQYNEVTNLVAHLNNVHFDNPTEAFAEVIVWTNDRNHGNRTVLYAGNGFYRDGCAYQFLFERFICTDRDQPFYISTYVTDRVGYTIQRVQSAYCHAPSEIPPSPEGCLNGGVSDNNKTCICAPNWTGDKCQSIVCLNNGTSLTTHCECRSGFKGQHCEIVSCNQQSWEEFSENRRSLTFLVHTSGSMFDVIQKMNEQMAQVVQDIRHQHPRWINQYRLIVFDDSLLYIHETTEDPNVFLASFASFAASVQYNSATTCKDLGVLHALYVALYTADVERYGLYYVFLNGYMAFDAKVYDQVQLLTESTQSEVNFVEFSTQPCGLALNSTDVGLMWSLSALTDGQVHIVSSANTKSVMRSIPLQYSAGHVYEKYLPDCTNGVDFYFPVDASMQSLSVLIDADFDVDPVYTLPNGDVATAYVQNIYNDYIALSRLDQIIASCDDYWRGLNGYCYRFFAAPTTWDNAQTACSNSGAHLASILNKDVENFLYNSANTNTFWTGLNDKAANGTFVWDQGTDTPLGIGSYTNWGTNQPNLGAGQCVSANKNDKWVVGDCSNQYAYVCIKHAYDPDFAPTFQSETKIPDGIWSLNVKSYEGGCAVSVYGQSRIQVYPSYVNDIHADIGSISPYSDKYVNYEVIHASGLEGGGNVQYGHFYTDTANLTMEQIVKFTERDPDSCAHQYISDSFQCSSLMYQVMISGEDQYGYAFQRIKPTLCYDAVNATCLNGGVFYQNKCVCPPRYGGDQCQFPFCDNGFLADNLVQCRCMTGYTGDFCETPVCLNGTTTIPETTENKTLIFIIDGSYSNGMQDALNTLNATLQGVLSATQTFDPTWFTQFIGVVAYDHLAPNRLSTRVEETDPNRFVNALVNVIQTANYTSKQNARSLFNALIYSLATDLVGHRSQAFIITAGNADDYDLLNPTMDLISYSHVSVNVVIIGDDGPPGGIDYRNPSVDSLHELTVLTSGGFYQVPATDLRTLLSKVIINIHNGYGIVYEAYHNCTSHTLYIQIGAQTTELLFEVFALAPVTLDVYDNNDSFLSIGRVVDTRTNQLFSVLPTNGSTYLEPGVYRLVLNEATLNIEHPFCTLGVKGVSPQSTFIGYSQDLGFNNGQHSNNGDLYPRVAPTTNALLTQSGFGSAQFAQFYDISERNLLWGSPLIHRNLCVYNFISAEIFRCPDATFAVALDGVDDYGHPYRRLEVVHCIGAMHTVAVAEMKHSFANLMKPLLA
uniref:EGF-like domain-containing protein n=1 Tax=Panagrellus redivivus TaxID=6233 RepID=A0A7E4VMC0_PANRE